MSQHSRISNKSSQSTLAIADRISILESTLEEINHNSQNFKKLNQLQQTLPQINRTEKSTKQLTKDIDTCYKQLSQIQAINQRQVLNIQMSAMQRNLKLASKSISQLKQSIKSMTGQFSDTQRSYHLNQTKELSLCRSNITSQIQRNKKQMNSIIKQFQQDCLLLQMNGTNKILKSTIQQIVKQKRQNWDEQIKKLNIQLGGMKCQSEFIKDKTKTPKVIQQLNALVDSSKQGLNKEFGLAIVQEQFQIDYIQDIVTVNASLIVKQLMQIQQQLSALINVLQKQDTDQDKRQHILRQVLYLNDRWFKLKNRLHAFRKKYLISMRDIEERLISLKNTKNTIVQPKIKQFGKRISDLNKRAEEYVKVFNEDQKHLDNMYKHLGKMIM